MSNNADTISLGQIPPKNIKMQKHTPSKIYADTLFAFHTELSHIIPAIEKRVISPRYCEEDIAYLKIPKYEKIVYPMKCFCDINMHRLEEHLHWYGYYGLAFSKAWGIRNKIQPVQYINPDANLRQDFTEAITAALKTNPAEESEAQKKLQSFLLHEMMFYKPYEGKVKNRNTGKFRKKCLADECEWRFIPNVSTAGYIQVYYDENILKVGEFDDINNSMFGISSISLSYDYSDLKYIIVKTYEDFKFLAETIAGLELNKLDKMHLLAKIIIWDDCKGDF